MQLRGPFHNPRLSGNEFCQFRVFVPPKLPEDGMKHKFFREGYPPAPEQDLAAQTRAGDFDVDLFRH